MTLGSTGRYPGSRGLATLIPVDLVPARALYEILYLSDAYVTWRTRGRVLSLDDFATLISESYVASYAVVDPRNDNALVGHVGLYGMADSSRVASMSAYFNPRHPGVQLVTGHALHALMDQAFGAVGLRKVVVEVPADLAPMLSKSEAWAPVVRHEGHLSQHLLMAGEYRDLDIFAIFATDYQRHFDGRDSPSAPKLDGPSYQALTELICEVAGIEMQYFDGGTLLFDDIGLDSLAIVEVIDRLDEMGADIARLPTDVSVLSVQDLFSLVEPSAE